MKPGALVLVEGVVSKSNASFQKPSLDAWMGLLSTKEVRYLGCKSVKEANTGHPTRFCVGEFSSPRKRSKASGKTTSKDATKRGWPTRVLGWLMGG